jgi:hypothetical protein
MEEKRILTGLKKEKEIFAERSKKTLTLAFIFALKIEDLV